MQTQADTITENIVITGLQLSELSDYVTVDFFCFVFVIIENVNTACMQDKFHDVY